MGWHSIVAFCFRIINFGLLGMVLVYIYKKYIRDVLIKGVSYEYARLKNLESQKKSMRDQQLMIENQCGDDQKVIAQLREKLSIWAQKEEFWHQNRDVDRKRRIDLLRSQFDFKELRIAECILKKESMSTIIAQAKKDLIKKYDVVKSSQYIENALASLPE